LALSDDCSLLDGVKGREGDAADEVVQFLEALDNNVYKDLVYLLNALASACAWRLFAFIVYPDNAFINRILGFCSTEISTRRADCMLIGQVQFHHLSAK